MKTFSLSDYHFDLPQELIAQYPVEPRDHSRLMIIDRKSQSMTDIMFHELGDFLAKGDHLVFNNTKVIPARLFGNRITGGRVEVFLTQQLSEFEWEALVKPGRKVKIGEKVYFDNTFFCEVVDILDNGNRRIIFNNEGDFNTLLKKFGHIPLPQYIKRSDDEFDVDRYQTVYAAEPGAVAAPTAGLHFTNLMLDRFQNKGIDLNYITLHVGPGTFQPVKCDDIRDHKMHSERFIISQKVADRLNQRDLNKQQIIVGTTCCRALESAYKNSQIQTGEFDTDIFMYPGYKFKYVKSLLTNFHLPGSTLLMLVTALGGYEMIMEAYRKAVEKKYRFFSYGDAMLIL